MKEKLVMLIWIFILAVAAYSMFGCKVNKVEDFSDHWAHHEVKVDANGIN